MKISGSSMSLEKVSDLIPKIEEKHFFFDPQNNILTMEKVCSESEKWIFYYPKDFVNEMTSFFEDWAMTELFRLIRSFSNPFKREFLIKNIPLLAAIYPLERCLYWGSRKLSWEITLKSSFSLVASSLSLSEETEKRWVTWQNHVKKIENLTLQEVIFPTEIEWITALHGLPNFFHENQWQDVFQEMSEIRFRIEHKMSEYNPSMFEKFSDFGLNLTAEYDLIRIHLLKFLALLPSLDHDLKGIEVKKCFLESFRRLLTDHERVKQQVMISHEARFDVPFENLSKPLPDYLWFIFSWLYFIATYIPSQLLSLIIRFIVKKMAKRFIAGENINNSHTSLLELRKSKRDATLDQLGELVVSSQEADEYLAKVLKLIQGLKDQIPQGEKNKAGILCAHVSIKVSALSHDFKAEAFEATYKKVAPRLKKILLEGMKNQVFINIDAEHYHFRDLVFKIYEKVLLESQELKNYDQTGIVVQAYLRDGIEHLQSVLRLAKKRALSLPVRLVKGAYWDAETIEGEAHQFIPPQFLNKEESDLNFRCLIHFILEHHHHLHLTIGSHNVEDHAFAEALRKKRFPLAPMIEHQCLHMTYEALSHALARNGFVTRNYIPIGDLIVGMGYLVRRIMENSSQVGVLSQMRSQGKDTSSPVDIHRQKKNLKLIKYDSFIEDSSAGDFIPTRPLRVYREDERAELEKEILSFENSLKSLSTKGNVRVMSSSDSKLLLGLYEETKVEEISVIVEQLEQGLIYSRWSDHSSLFWRTSVFLKAQHKLLAQRNHFAALLMYEAGKTLQEALADVDEAIDFINFYLREEIDLLKNNPHVFARGVISVIAPWNFPLAILCGMSVAALVAGNAVVMKPAEQTSLIAQKFYELLISSGVPREVLSLVLGPGETVGDTLTKHPRVAVIVFTGSKNVGSMIFKRESFKVIPHYLHQFPMQKKVIAELGGKNAIIVSNNCELDETVAGILYSAFGHAGQKCSAASRILVHRDVKEILIKRLRNAVNDLKVGKSYDLETSINPLITKEDQQRVKVTIEKATDEILQYGGRVILDRSNESFPGFCVGPALFEISKSRALDPDSWAQKEIFGPVLHLIEYETLDEVIHLFNGTSYALTGGIFSQSQDEIDYLLKHLEAGNLYVNRSNTGARVAIEPFGGFKMSGTGPKAGGKDYLKEFHFFQHSSPHFSLDSLLKVSDSKLKRELQKRLSEKQNHFKIPGQLSFNDRRMRKKSFAVIGEKMGEKGKIYLKVAEVMDLDFFRFPDEKKIDFKKLQLIDVVYSHDLSTLKNFLETSDENAFLPKLLSENDGILVKNLEDVANLFIHHRSMAINTMRHGAPMEVEA